MKKLLSFVIVTLMIVSSIVPVFSVTEADVVTPSEENRFSVWAEDTEFDPASDEYVTVYFNVSNNDDGFEYLKWFVIYPECLTLVNTEAAGFADDGDLTPGSERTEPDGLFTRALMTLRGYDVGEGDEYDTPAQKAAYEARTKELLDGKKWTSPLFDCERKEVGPKGKKITVDCFDNGRICMMEFEYDATLNPTGADLNIELWEDYEGGLHSGNPTNPEWADEWAYYDADNYGCVVKLPHEEPTEPVLTVSNVTINEGDPTATFDVTASGNPGLWGTKICFVYDEDMKYNTFKNGEVFPDSAMPTSPLNTPNMRDQTPANTFKKIAFTNLQAAFEAAGVSYENKLLTIAQYENNTFTNVTANGTLFSITLDTSALAAGEYDICIVYQPDDMINCNGDNVTFALVQGKLTVVGVTCEHEHTTTEHKDATCTEDGYTRVTCDDCGEVISEETIGALGHDYVAGTPVAPTCTDKGYTTYTCSRCGDSYDGDFVDALGHTAGEAVKENVVPADCTNPGSYDEVVYCTVCGDELSRESKAEEALGHDWKVIGTSGTCEEYGTVTYKCERCGEEKTETGEYIDHIWAETEHVDPTCTAPGYTKYHCDRCGKDRQDDFDALGHDYVAVVTEPTCTEDGFTTYTCSRCGDVYTDDIVEKLGHDYAAVVTEPTCTEDGFTTYTCSRCGDTYTADPVEKLGHDPAESVKENVVEATCTEGGSYDLNTYCDRCGELLESEHKTTEALGHDYVAGTPVAPTCTDKGYTTYTCSRCGDHYDADFEEALGHDYAEVVTEPTCTEAGYSTFTCTRCGDSYVVEGAPALGHDRPATGVEENRVEPTCTEAGSTQEVFYCTRCGAELERNTYPIAPLGHDWDDGVATAPTCTEAGFTTFTCKRCGDSYDVEGEPALGHDWDDGVATEPTCEEDGGMLFTCKRCGETKLEDAIPALGHDWDDGKITKEATVDEEGEKTFTCKRDPSHTKIEIIPKLEPQPEPQPQPQPQPQPTPGGNGGGSKQTGDNITTLVFVAMIAAISGAAVIVAKKKLFNK